jgi:hypothetical protein
MTLEYLFVMLPKGVVPKSVGFEPVVSMELSELGKEGWRVVTANRSGIGFTPLEVLLERESR